MSQICTLYRDKEMTDARYPRTVIEAVIDSNGTPINEYFMFYGEEADTSAISNNASARIITLFSSEEKTDALYPRTKIGAVVNDDNNTLAELLEGLNTSMGGKVNNGGGATSINVLTQSEYDAIGTKDGTTLYVIKEG